MTRSTPDNRRPPTLLIACSLLLGAPTALPAVALQDASTRSSDAAQDTAPERVLPIGERHALDNVTFELGGMPVHVVSLTETGDGDTDVTVEFLEQPGSRAVVRRDQLPREVRYRMFEARIAPETRAEWVQVADRAAELNLRLRHFEALRSAREASDTRDAGLDQRFAEAREAVAALRVERARAYRADDRLIQALNVLEDTAARLQPADSARLAGELAARWDADTEASTEGPARTGADGGRTLPDDPKLRSAADSLAKGREELERSRVVAGEDTGEQRETLTASLAALRDAQRKLGGAADLARDEADEATDSPRARLQRTTRDLLVHVHVELGYLELHLDDERAAYEHASLAAALDPEDPAVSDLRSAIAVHDAG